MIRSLIFLVMIATVPLMQAPAASAAESPQVEQMALSHAVAKVKTGKFKGRLYDATPKKGTKINFKVKKRGKRFIATKWSATVEMFCVDGSRYYEQSMGMTVPRVKLSRRGKGHRTWSAAHGVNGQIKLRVKGKKLIGTLEYQASNCDLYDNKIKMTRKR